VKFGLQERAIILKNQRKSHREIAEILVRESGRRIHHQDVDNYLNTQYKILKLRAKEDAEL